MRRAGQRNTGDTDEFEVTGKNEALQENDRREAR
jgi:hypothetical protein